MMRFIALLLAAATLGTGFYFVYQNFGDRTILIESNRDLAYDQAQTLLQWFLILGVASSFLLALLIYSVLATKARARSIAYSLSKDIAFSRERFRKFYELSPLPYLLITPKGEIRRPNKAALRFFGMSEDELIGKNIFSFLTLSDHPEKLSMYKEQVARKIPIEQKEIQVTRKNGEARWALLSVEDLEGNAVTDHEQLRLATLADIHEQKELERIKTEFLSLASHQLRAPLANLKWYIDFLITRRASALNDEVRGYLEKMNRRNEDMIELVNTFLNLSRIEMGRVKVEKQQTDIVPLAQSVLDELEPTAREKNITIERSLPEKAVFNTDGKLIRVVVQNLLSNAIRYTKEGGHVFVRVSDMATKVHIEVEDNGVGIPPEEQGRIFSKLYRATNAQKIEANGNGIGLYMCKALVEGMGGSIAFKSVHNQGTTFTVDLDR